MPKTNEIFYDPETGEIWRRAGTLCASGYRQVWFEGVQHMEHRLVWFLHYGGGLNYPSTTLTVIVVITEFRIYGLRRARKMLEIGTNPETTPPGTKGFLG